MSDLPIGISALAVALPNQIRTNKYFEDNRPEFVAGLREKIAAPQAGNIFDGGRDENWQKFVVNPHSQDPFRGSRERRILGLDETGLDLQIQASKQALKIAGLEIGEIDCIIAVSMFSETNVGNAAALCGELKSDALAMDLGATCSGGLVSLLTACALVQSSNPFKKILIAVVGKYSKYTDLESTLGISLGDGAAAFIVEQKAGVATLQNFSGRNTADTCGLVYDQAGIITVNKDRAKEVPSFFIKYFKDRTTETLKMSGLQVSDLDFFCIYPPAAGYVAYCAATLGFDPDKAIDIFPSYGNISAASILVTLHHAASLGKIKPGYRGLVYAHGFSGSAAAVIVGWGSNVALGPMPEGLENEKFEVR